MVPVLHFKMGQPWGTLHHICIETYLFVTLRRVMHTPCTRPEQSCPRSRRNAPRVSAKTSAVALASIFVLGLHSLLLPLIEEHYMLRHRIP